jgi:hypothetical protein
VQKYDIWVKVAREGWKIENGGWRNAENREWSLEN